MRYGWLILAPVLAACGVSVLGTAPLPDGGGDAEVISRDGGPTTGDADLPDVELLDSSDGSDGACDPSACPGARCESNACSTYAHCKELHDNVPAAKSGTYMFRRPAAAVTFTAYCEMTIAGGGWTLVGQSVAAGTSNSFGWTTATGSLTDTTKPYSLDAFEHGLVPTATLLATGTRGAIGATYVVKVPTGFPAGLQNSSASTTGTTLIKNSLCPTGGDSPNMMNRMGFTDLTGQFYYRDVSGVDVYGLRPNGWSLAYNDCSQGGMLNGKQGMLFAR